MPRDRRQQPVAGAIERGEQLDEGVAKPRRARRPHVRRHHVGEAMPRGQLAPDVPEFLQVDVARVLRDLGLERRIAARTALPLKEIAALLRIGQREQLLGRAPRPRDQLLRHAMVRHDGEAEALERAADRRREARGVAVLFGQAQRRHLRGGSGGIEHRQRPFVLEPPT